eukprot:226821_1
MFDSSVHPCTDILHGHGSYRIRLFVGEEEDSVSYHSVINYVTSNHRTQNGASKRREAWHQTTTKPPYPAMQKKRKHLAKEKLRQKGEEPSKSISPKESNAIQWTNWTMCLDPPSHSTRCKVTGIGYAESTTQQTTRNCQQRSRPTHPKYRRHHEKSLQSREPNGPPKAEDLCGFHGDSMAMTKQFPLQSMIHLNEPIVKQREKEKHELRSETTRKEECLRNI